MSVAGRDHCDDDQKETKKYCWSQDHSACYCTDGQGQHEGDDDFAPLHDGLPEAMSEDEFVSVGSNQNLEKASYDRCGKDERVSNGHAKARAHGPDMDGDHDLTTASRTACA